MSLKIGAAKVKKDYGRVEDGAYPARIVEIIDFGQQIETDWKTKEVKCYEDGNLMIKPKVWITFEFPDELITVDGVDKPRWYGKDYTVSAHEKSAMASLMKAVDPKNTSDGYIPKLLGLPAMVTMGSTSTGNAKIAGVSAVPKGMQVGALVSPESFFDLDSGTVEAFNGLPRWMQEKIKGGVGFDGTKLADKLSKTAQTPTEVKVRVEDY